MHGVVGGVVARAVLLLYYACCAEPVANEDAQNKGTEQGDTPWASTNNDDDFVGSVSLAGSMTTDGTEYDAGTDHASNVLDLNPVATAWRSTEGQAR